MFPAQPAAGRCQREVYLIFLTTNDRSLGD
jgi:hypothetical protein